MAGDDASRRRLPQWMLGISSSGQVKKPGKENDKQLEGGLASQPHENETLGENSHVLVKCDTKRRKRKSTVQDTDYEGNVPETVPEKKCNRRWRRKVQESAAPTREKTEDPGKGIQVQEKETLGENTHVLAKCETKRRKRKSNEQEECEGNSSGNFPEKKCNGRRRRKVKESDAPKGQNAKDSSCESDEEQEVRSLSDDDVELTVEDLVTIAEEYIKAGRNMEQEAASNQECELDIRIVERVSSGNKLKDSVDAQNFDRRMHIPATTTSKPNRSLMSQDIAFSSSTTTGDPAQEMLDLFLGPLLKKTVEKETMSQLWREDVEFAREMKGQSQSNVVREEIAPIMKKKSSLKDKVALFL